LRSRLSPEAFHHAQKPSSAIGDQWTMIGIAPDRRHPSPVRGSPASQQTVSHSAHNRIASRIPARPALPPDIPTRIIDAITHASEPPRSRISQGRSPAPSGQTAFGTNPNMRPRHAQRRTRT